MFHLAKEQQCGPLWQWVAPAKDQVGHLNLPVAEFLAGFETTRLLTLIASSQNEKVSPAWCILNKLAELVGVSRSSCRGACSQCVEVERNRRFCCASLSCVLARRECRRARLEIVAWVFLVVCHWRVSLVGDEPPSFLLMWLLSVVCLELGKMIHGYTCASSEV